MATRLPTRRFSVDDYYRMAEAGILTADDRVELIEGQIVQMTPIGSRHAACVDRLTRLLTSVLGERAIVRVQSPVRLGPHSEPQPDLALLRPRTDFYAQAHPGPANILLVIEVADSSAEPDRTVKLPLYAMAGIPAACLVLLAEERLELHEGPAPEGYRVLHRLQRRDRLTLESFPELTLSVDEILGTP